MLDIRDAAIAAIQAIADNPPSHDPGVCLDMAIRAVSAAIPAASAVPAGVTEAAVDDDSLRILWQFADMYRSGEQGAQMDFGAAQALALSIDDALDVLARLAAIPLLSPSMGWETPTFQARVEPWMDACFGPEISGDKVERGDRFLEEVFETLQSGGYDPARIVPLRDYVWSRPVGEPSQEVGGVMVMVTLAAYCLAFGLDTHAAAETELARIWTKVEKIRANQAAKPRFSPLPIALPPANGEGR